MPLPPALLARLAQRGLVKGLNEREKDEHRNAREVPDINAPANGSSTGPSDPPEEEEEVFAEDYDTAGGAPEIGPRLPKALERARRAPHEPIGAPVPECPNKWNAHHRCVVWCTKRWGNGIPEEDPANARKRLRMLRKFPLPPKWSEEYDPGTGRYYYWHKDGKQVSWLSPSHPRAQITMPAQKFREVLSAGDDDDESAESGSDVDDEADDEEVPASRKEKTPSGAVNRSSGPAGRGNDRKRRRGGGRGDDSLDPMDPSSYSDTCPRGGWSAGLDRDTASDRAADHTASGPLYQQRPYPSPGDVLRMNKSKEK